MYCKNCGKEIDDNAYICPNCGVKVSNGPVVVEDENSSIVCWGVLSFLIPLVGLILFLMWKDSRPRAAKTSGKCALISVIIRVVGGILLNIIYGIIIASFVSFTSYYTLMALCL